MPFLLYDDEQPNKHLYYLEFKETFEEKAKLEQLKNPASCFK